MPRCRPSACWGICRWSCIPIPAEVLVIAFGGGITLSAGRIAPADSDSIAPSWCRAFRALRPILPATTARSPPASTKRPIELVAEDGRNHVLRTQRQYDAIICDATHPGTADSWVLYTEEFYRLCRGRVGPDGLVAQWLPLHGLSVEDYKMILADLSGRVSARFAVADSSVLDPAGYAQRTAHRLRGA